MSESPQNILFLSSWYPSRVHPTLGNFVQRHAESVALKNNVTVIYPVFDPNFKKRSKEIVKEQQGKITVYYIYLRKRKYSGFWHLIRKFKRVRSAVMKLIRSEKLSFDLIHSNILYPNGLLAYYCSKKLSIPFVCSIHWTGYLPSERRNLSFWKLWISKRISSKAAFLSPVSEHLKSHLLKLNINGNFKVVPNTINSTLFHYKNKPRNSILKFLHVSTLIDEHKNISGLLASIKKLSETRSDFSFTIVGDGDYLFFEKQANQLGIPKENISFMGEQSTERVASLMQNHDAFVLFSNKENLPCVLIEAISCGLPSISTNVGGVAELIRPNNGILIEKGNEKQLLLALNDLLERYDDYNRKEFAEKFNKIYGFEAVGEQFDYLYREISKK